MDSPSTLAYRPYKSKRHSRTLSLSHVASSPAPDAAAPDDDEPAHSAPPPPRPASAVAAAANGHASAPPPPTASSSTLAPTSTFRRVVPVAQPHAPSPLRPRPPHAALTVSPSFARRFDAPQPAPARRPRTPSPAVPARALPPSSTPSPAPPAPPTPPATASPTPPPPPPSAPHSPSPTPSASTSASASAPAPRRPAAPYRPGFQPKGVYRPRTDEFLAARAAVRDRAKVEQRRLERRLEKLIALHFPPEPPAAPAPEPPPPAPRRASALFDLDFRKPPAELWRDVVEARIQRPAKPDIRAEEQRITPWADDAAAAQCAVCAAAFHALSNRKHHCRLCGRVVCAAPCSLLFVADARTGRIDEVGEGVDYGVRRSGADDRFLRGVRICRDCRGVLRRQQYVQDARHVPTYARLYSTLTSLEREIEDALAQFHELVLALSAPSPSPDAPAAAALRARLLAAFGEYDRLAQRIRQLPAARGGSQDRVQRAILARANLFLQRHMFPLQALPKPGAAKADAGAGAGAAATDQDAALAHALQPLLEQEALLEAFVEEARAQRKFEDARTLKASLGEIRAEIERIAGAAGAA